MNTVLDQIRYKRLVTAIMLSLAAAAPSLASEHPAALRSFAATAFRQQQQKLLTLKASTVPAERLAYARLLAAGLIQNDHNPLKAPGAKQAITVYRTLLGVDDKSIQSDAVKELQGLLAKSDDPADVAEAQRIAGQLQADTPAKTDRLKPNDALATEMLAGSADALQREMAAGSIDAGFQLLDLLVSQNAPEADTVRSQVIYMANVAAVGSDSKALKYASRYLSSPDAKKHPAEALILLNAAAATGSDSVISLVDDNRDFLVKALGAEKLRKLVWDVAQDGSTRAAELIALDLVEHNAYGFDEEDSMWAVKALTEIGVDRADYLNAKLYYQGIYVKKDIPRAIAAMDKMLASVRSRRAEIEITANRYSRLGLSSGLTAKYALPLYMQLWHSGKTTAISHIARIVMNAQRSGYYQDLNQLPIRINELLSGLNQAYSGGDSNAGLIAADIYREGLLVPGDIKRAEAIYRTLLEASQDDQAFKVKIEERIAKAVRQNLDNGSDHSRYYAMVRALVAKQNLWAMKEYGSLLISGGPQMAKDETQGFDLLIKALSRGYFSAGSVAANLAILKGDPKMLDDVLAAYASVDQRTLPPESRIALASVDFRIKAYDKAVALLSSPEVKAIPRGQFLLAQVNFASGAISPADTATDMAATIAHYSGEASELVGFVNIYASLPGMSPQECEPALERLALLADRGDTRAVDVALKLHQKWPTSQALGFRRVVKWSRQYAERGRGDALSRIAMGTSPRSVSREDYVFLLDNVEQALPKLPTNGNLRMLIARQYLAGKYRPKDLDKADEFAYQAALLGNTEALNAIAVNYFYGQGVELDRARSDQLFRTLAYIGSNRSTIAIARNYSKGPSARVYESRAFAYYTKAAYNGSITAMMELGRSYLAGAGTEQDDAKGVLWLERAADRHNTDAMTQLYFHYFIRNPTINNPDAEKWLDRLVAEDVPDMIVRKAVLLNTRDSKANREQVFALLDHAEKLGSQFARRLKNVYVKRERGDE